MRSLIKIIAVISIIFLIGIISVLFLNSKPINETSKSKDLDNTDDHSISIAEFSYMILNTYPHNSTSFTQGLEYRDGYIYESTGLYSQSTVRITEIGSGNDILLKKLPDELFGEGLTLVGDTIYQLTWKSGRGLMYDIDTLLPVGNFNYSAEGWGLCFDGENLIMSDGSDTLYRLDTNNFTIIDAINVTEEGRPVDRINEMEFINGTIFANIWKSSRIIQISPTTGEVIGEMDLSNITDSIGIDYPGSDVLNGIAYRDDTGTILITGKLWPIIYELKIEK